MIYGLHIDSTPETIMSNINKYNKLKIIQLFVSLGKTKRKYYDEIIQKYKNKILFSVHISYIINIALDSSVHSWWIRNIVEQIKLAHEIGAFCVVIHLGKSLDLSIETAMNNMYINLLKVHNKLDKIPIKILIETSTGQGTEMCYTIEKLAKFFNKFTVNKELSDRFGICLDTCHIFNAGYDIGTKDNVIKYMDKFEELIGVSKIKLIHLNNSKNIL